MAKDPRTMNRTELTRWLKEFLRINNRNSIQDLADQWDLHDKINGLAVLDNIIKDNDKVQLKSTKTRFMKVYFEELYTMFDQGKIDALDIGNLILLGKFVDYEDNTLKNEEGNYLSRKDIMRVLKMSSSTMKRFLNRMIDAQIIFSRSDETDVKRVRKKFFINPHILYKGKYIDKKIKERLDVLRKQLKEIEKLNGKKVEKNNLIDLLDRLKEEDYSDMDDDEIDALSEELFQLVV